MMNGKTFIWHLRAGGKTGQQTREIKLAEGYEYIKRLEDEGENVLRVEEKADKLIIQLEDK